MRDFALCLVLIFIALSCNMDQEVVAFDYTNHQISASKSKITILNISNPCENIDIYRIILKENKVGLQTIDFYSDSLSNYYDILDTTGFFKRKPNCDFIQISINSSNEYISYSFFGDIKVSNLNKKNSIKSELH